jgi:hypothetical protein
MTFTIILCPYFFFSHVFVSSHSNHCSALANSFYPCCNIFNLCKSSMAQNILSSTTCHYTLHPINVLRKGNPMLYVCCILLKIWKDLKFHQSLLEVLLASSSFFEHHKDLDFGVQSRCLKFKFFVLKKRRIDGTITKRLQAHNQVYYK